MISKGGKKGIGGIGDNQRYQIALLCFQAPGIGVDLIMKEFNGFLHLFSIDIADRKPIYHL